MLHLLPESAPEFAPGATPEPVTRLASLRNALRVVDPFGGGPASDFDVDEMAADWAGASEAQQRCFDRRSAALVGVATAGLEAVSEHRETGGDVNPAAIDVIADEIRTGLESLERLLKL